MQKISISSLSYNRPLISDECIKHNLDILDVDKIEYEFFITSQGLPQNNIWLQTFNDKRITKKFIYHKNEGKHAQNLAFKNATTDLFLELDDDIKLVKGIIPLMLDIYNMFLKLKKNIGMVAYYIDAFRGFKYDKLIIKGEQLGMYGIIDCNGGIRLTSRHVWEKIGGQPKLNYGTDVLMNKKIFDAGLMNVVLKLDTMQPEHMQENNVIYETEKKTYASRIFRMAQTKIKKEIYNGW